MLQFQDGAGYTWYLNHLISFVVLSVALFWACKQLLTGHKDKFLHIMVSAVLTMIFIWCCLLFKVSWWISPIVVVLIGVGKEIYDRFYPRTHTCDIKDFLADSIGIVAITVFYFCSFVIPVIK